MSYNAFIEANFQTETLSFIRQNDTGNEKQRETMVEEERDNNKREEDG